MAVWAKAVVAASVLALLAGSTAAPTADSTTRIQALDAKLPARAKNLRLAGGFPEKAGRVQAVVEVEAERAAVERLVGRLGGDIELAHANLIQALVPSESLEDLAGSPLVRLVRPPLLFRPAAVGGEEVQVSGASALHQVGTVGTGTRVAIIDGGFAGLAESQARGDLPASLAPVDFCQGAIGSSNHGTAVAEIVHEMAPGAQLFLLCVQTDVSVGVAMNHARSVGAHIINMSGGFPASGRGDGSGPPGSPDAAVAAARASDILWVNAAGNEAQKHWSGTFSDPDADRWHNFTASDEAINFTTRDRPFCFFLKWDDWPASTQDYDLALISASGQVIAASRGSQTGTQPPREGGCVDLPTGTTVGLGIWRDTATRAPRFDLYNDFALEYPVAAGSVVEPASSPSSFTAGAVCWQSLALEPYSSQGPTIDGRTKPDITGYDSTSSGVYGGFAGCGVSAFTGTSAASPSVAGAAALVKQRFPTFRAADLQAFLEQNSLDLGTAGKDNLFGSGRLFLPAAPAQPPPTPSDTSPPQARAHPSLGSRGGRVKLWLSVSDDSGQARIVVTVVRRGRTIATIRRGFRRSTGARNDFVWWRAPRITGTMRHCVQAFDRAANASKRSCASLELT